jgi:hypothetical protein
MLLAELLWLSNVPEFKREAHFKFIDTVKCTGCITDTSYGYTIIEHSCGNYMQYTNRWHLQN